MPQNRGVICPSKWASKFSAGKITQRARHKITRAM